MVVGGIAVHPKSNTLQWHAAVRGYHNSIPEHQKKLHKKKGPKSFQQIHAELWQT